MLGYLSMYMEETNNVTVSTKNFKLSWTQTLWYVPYNQDQTRINPCEDQQNIEYVFLYADLLRICVLYVKWSKNKKQHKS